MFTNEIIYSLTEFVLLNKTEKDPFELFNKWRDEKKYILNTYKEAVGFIQYIDMLLNTDSSVIKEGLSKDKILIKGDF